MRQAPGLSLVELLVAAAVMTVILSVLGYLFVGAERAQSSNARLAERMQNLDIAAQLLSYEVGLAGYRGTSSAGVAGNDFGGDAVARLTVAKSETGGSDAIEVRYYEDRYLNSGDSELRVATYSVGPDGEGSSLMRRLGAGDEHPAVAGVARLSVEHYILRDGTKVPATASTTMADVTGASPLVALELRLELTSGHARGFTVTLDNLALGNPAHRGHVDLSTAP